MTATTLMLRDLANAAASHPQIEAAVTGAIRTVLAGVIESILREQYPGERVSFYVAKRPASARRDRDAAIRAEFTGANIRALSVKYGLSQMQVYRIVK